MLSMLAGTKYFIRRKATMDAARGTRGRKRVVAV